MPRKKQTEEISIDTPAPKAPRSRAKAAAKTEATAEPIATPIVEEVKPKRGRPKKVVEEAVEVASPTQVEEPAAAEEPVKPKAARGRKPKTEAEPESVKPARAKKTDEPAAKPARSKKKELVAVVEARPQSMESEGIQISFRAKQEHIVIPTGPTIHLTEGATPRQIAELCKADFRAVQKILRTDLDLSPSLDALLAEGTARRLAEKLGYAVIWEELEDSPEEEAAPLPQAPVESEAKPKRGRKPKAVESTPRERPDLSGIPENERLAVVWRAKSEIPAETGEQSEDDSPVGESPEDPNESRGRRKRQRRRGRGRDQQEDETGEIEDAEEPIAAQPEVKAPEPAPAIPAREKVSIPVDAPQVVVHEGTPTLVRDRKVASPLVFFASAMDERSLNTMLEEVKMAAEGGIHTFSLLTELEVSRNGAAHAASFAAFQMKKLLEVDPEAQIIVRLVFSAPSGWQADFPDAAYRRADRKDAEPSFCDDQYWGQAEESLSKFIELLTKMPVGSSLFGVHLERGEWFFADGDGYDSSKAAVQKFRGWLKHRYGGDKVSLRASWFDGKADFDNVEVPAYRPKDQDENFVRTDRRARRWVDYHLFLSDTIVERIADLAYAAKKAAEGKIVVGVSYGYTFEWAHPGSGHLSLGKLLRCPDLDYIAGPPSYKNREPGGSAPLAAPIDSFALNGKLALSEEDFKTTIPGLREPDDFNPVMKTPQALEAAHWRGIGAALAHGGGVSWMDTWGNGWLNSRGIWERAAKVQEIMMLRLGSKTADPDVAMFIDERSLAYLVDERAFGILVQNVRESILRAGMSVGFYLLSDLAHRENFPEAKLHVFVNAWDIRPEVRSAIKSRLQRDGKVLFWLYCAGLFEGGRESLERAREATGIAIRPQPFDSRPGTNLLNVRDPLCRVLPEGLMAEGGQLEPSYFAIPEDARVLGEYASTGLPSFVVRQFPTPGTQDEPWTSVFLGEPVVTPGLFRALGEMAGCHVWNHDDDVIHARAPFLTIHCTGAGQRTITLPDKWVAYDVVRREWPLVEGSRLKFNALDGSTHSFVVGHRADVEAILNSPTELTLSDEEIVAHQDNTVQWDAIKFDVPIMKLGEWVEESWSEEMADDLLLRPSMIDVDLDATGGDDPREPSARRGSAQRRKRRKGGSGSSGDRRERDQGQRMGGDDEAGVSFLFRKRE